MNVLLVGITGQTAAYVTKFLLELGFEVTGSSRDKARANLSNLQRVGVNTSKLCIISLDPADPRQVFCVLANSSYDIIINLAGQTSVGLSFDQPAQSLDSIITSCLNFIEAIKSLKLKAIYFNAASSECFGNTDDIPASEQTPFKPNSPYAVAKASPFHLTRLAREAYGIQAFSGILSNHESPLRGSQFDTARIINQLKLIKNGSESQLVLGNLKTTRDWGFAPDYAKAIVGMISSNVLEDVIIATGESHSLREFIHAAAKELDIHEDFKIVQDMSLVRPLDVEVCRLNPSKIKRLIGWSSTTTFPSMVSKLVHGDLF